MLITAVEGGKKKPIEDGSSKCEIFTRIVRDNLTEKEICEPDLTEVRTQ